MTPITIKPAAMTMTIHELREKLNFQSYTFCVNADFSKEDAMTDLVTNLEMYAMEALLRVLDNKLGYRPLQNKIYEKTEYAFGNQDAYNINRMMSSLRRAKMYPIDPTDERYIDWLKNRVKYGVKGLRQQLKAIDYSGYDYSKEQHPNEAEYA